MIYKVLSLFSGCGGMDLGIEGDFSFLGKFRGLLGLVWASHRGSVSCTKQTVMCSDEYLLGTVIDQRVVTPPDCKFLSCSLASASGSYGLSFSRGFMSGHYMLAV